MRRRMIGPRSLTVSALCGGLLLLIGGSTLQARDDAKAEAKTEHLFRAGAALSNITPPLGSPIVGNFVTPPATHIHDDLHARCLVLDDGKTRLAFAICDNVGIPREVFDAAKKMIKDETGLPESNVILAANHTHSATSARSPNSMNPESELSDYQKFLARRIADGIHCAINNLEPAQIAWGSADVPDQVFNRRWLMKPGTPLPNPQGGQDKAKMN
ncbi:MAG: neutral/alkaline non-lysosomal ceramidase N-terminal domain-containing protein, partial [Isosphaeraceae bacterium]